MFQSSRSREVGSVAGFLISWLAVYWVLSQLPVRQHDAWFKTGFAAALFSVTAAFVFLFAVCLSYIGRQRHWSARTCHMAGIWILIPGALLCFMALSDRTRQWAAVWILNLPLLTGYICGKLVHPELTDDEAYAPEPPLMLFPK